MRTLKEIGETGLIDSIARLCPLSARVRRGPGDDAAVIASGGAKDLLLSTDMLLEDRHFRLREATPYEIGWKAMAVNISDIAAMGGVPDEAVVALGAPSWATLGFLKEVYRGLAAAARRFGVSIVGGDTNASAKWALAVTLLGNVERGKAVLRSGAKPGDWILVSGSLGGSYDSKKHLRFVPRIREARWLVKNFRVHAMMDLSDGLAADIRRIAAQSRVGAVLEEQAIPVSREARSVEHALSDGEDFELLFTMRASEARRLLGRRRPAGFPRFSFIGKITKRRDILFLKKNGRTEKMRERGFDHFR